MGSTRTRSSARILHLGLPHHLVREVTGQIVDRTHVHLPVAKQRAQLDLQRRHPHQTRHRARRELHQEVDVAVAPVLDVAAVDLASLRERLGDGRSDVVCLTSVHAVDAVVDALRLASGLDARVLAGYVVGAVGSATADRLLERLGVRADVIGAGSGADLASELAPYGSGSVLYPSSDRADSSLADAFATYGRAIDQVVSYRVVNRALGPDEVASVVRADAVVVASPSAAESLAQSVAPDRWPHVVALGPRSADAARAWGCGEITVASRPTLPALLGALEDLRVRSGPAATDS